jgi:anti-sigma factor RsiW
MGNPVEESHWLHAYHDGELRGLARWRAKRRLRRDPEARHELEQLGRVRQLVREAVPAPAPPDVWGAIAGRLPALDAEGDATAPAAPARRAPPAWLVPATAGALAAAALAVAVLVGPSEPATTGVVRWLDTEGQAVMVLERGEDATIIWVLEPAEKESAGRWSGHAVL